MKGKIELYNISFFNFEGGVTLFKNSTFLFLNLKIKRNAFWKIGIFLL